MQQREGYVTTEDGVRLFFLQIGKGPAVILPNAFHLFEDFQHFAERRTLIFYDVRNRGRSDFVNDAAKRAKASFKTQKISTPSVSTSKSAKLI